MQSNDKSFPDRVPPHHKYADQPSPPSPSAPPPYFSKQSTTQPPPLKDVMLPTANYSVQYEKKYPSQLDKLSPTTGHGYFSDSTDTDEFSVQIRKTSDQKPTVRQADEQSKPSVSKDDTSFAFFFGFLAGFFLSVFALLFFCFRSKMGMTENRKKRFFRGITWGVFLDILISTVTVFIYFAFIR